MNNDREDAIATALCAFNDLGHSVTPKFLSRNSFIYNDLHIVLKWTKTERGKLQKFQDFCPPDIESCQVRETMVVKYELVL